jgi:hypothetical protein
MVFFLALLEEEGLRLEVEPDFLVEVRRVDLERLVVLFLRRVGVFATVE